MNGNKLAALAFAASLAASTLPAFAATTTGTVTVKWNTQALASIVLVTQPSAALTHTGPSSIFWASNPGASTTSGCNGVVATSASGSDASANLTINFGNVTPDTVNYTDCLEKDAINAQVVNNDTNGWNVTEQMTAGVPTAYATATGELLCLLPNPAGAYAKDQAWLASARAAAVSITSTTACPVGDFPVLSASATTLLTVAAAGTAPTAGTNFPADMELAISPNAASNTVVATVTYTLTTL